METAILDLFKKYAGDVTPEVMKLPASGSARCYFRIKWGQNTCIAAYNSNVQENRLFVDFTSHFRQKGLHVPEIYEVSEDGLCYLQEDLGDMMLLNVVEQEKTGEVLNTHAMGVYRKALSELLRFQLIGGQGLDYSRCMPRPAFDRQCILWDLNYFKYCFLRLVGVDFPEQGLEDDFQRLASVLCAADSDSFMFRDFQSRNIMVKDGEVWFIDYQGGRQGALHYDVASLLYDAIAEIPEIQREELLFWYIAELESCRKESAENFLRFYYHFVLIRLLQAMGAFGLRGLYERKQHFIDSIQPGLKNIVMLFSSGKLRGEYPEIQRVCERVLANYEK